MLYLQVNPYGLPRRDHPKTCCGVLKRRSILDVWGPPNPTVAGKNLLAHNAGGHQASRRCPNVAPSGILDMQIFIRSHRSFTNAMGFTTLSDQVILPVNPPFWRRSSTRQAAVAAARRLTSARRRPALVSTKPD